MSIPTQIQLDGQTYTGSYEVDGPNVTVRYLSRTMSRSIGTTPPAVAAKGLMIQLVKIVQDLKHAS
ncbi:hypothetical protein [Hirschia baltica]|uniref:Uncharacterized protein n=1 Tax=Hirschia baltica (strain ATCC 49814 / DSM 5838 / IFAM 1418) TaxID=582402 RepID=C6XK70_HIRBI|nr:hypothetical protein [Hirschia baltica]ACT59515.1 hypothetical protein Hbal_1829 [Hirschia baltica ATCC 49814]